VIKQSYRHVFSDEPCEYVDDGDDQRFDPRSDVFDTVPFDARGDVVEANGTIAKLA